MRYSRSVEEAEQPRNFTPNEGYVVLHERDFLAVFGTCLSKFPTHPKLGDVRGFLVGLAVKGQMPDHVEALVKSLVECDQEWGQAYALVRGLE